jgi:protein-S-isoprenylcysteine O-methyltransferase Ste14
VWLFLRAVLWTALMPCVVAGVIPWRYFGLADARIVWSDPECDAAVALIATGVSVLAACIVEFARRGRGTLSPADPPRHLVVHGLYRYVRNPMYVAVSLILLGEALLVRSRDLVFYWVVFFTLANVFILVYEEPHLRSRFGAEYDDYARRVGRWIPRL